MIFESSIEGATLGLSVNMLGGMNESSTQVQQDLSTHVQETATALEAQTDKH
jgi:hypothetical protein